jgi:hypothetical protein
MIVSNPENVSVGITDLTTGCGYRYTGASVEDCIRYFQSLFFGKRQYKLDYVEELNAVKLTLHYAGVGSRETPESILITFSELAGELASLGYTLRSGAADGADSSFEQGCDMVNGDKEIFIPWTYFNGSNSSLYNLTDEAKYIASKYYYRWNYVKDSTRKLMTRNVYQVLGYDLVTPSKFIVCWTPEASGSGGTGQAIRIAKDYKIPVFDFGNPSMTKEIVLNCAKYIKENGGKLY